MNNCGTVDHISNPIKKSESKKLVEENYNFEVMRNPTSNYPIAKIKLNSENKYKFQSTINKTIKYRKGRIGRNISGIFFYPSLIAALSFGIVSIANQDPEYLGTYLLIFGLSAPVAVISGIPYFGNIKVYESNQYRYKTKSIPGPTLFDIKTTPLANTSIQVNLGDQSQTLSLNYLGMLNIKLLNY